MTSGGETPPYQAPSPLPRMAAAAGIGMLALRVNPLRTVLSTLGVVMGVASVVGVLSLGDGVAAFARDQVARTTDLQSVAVVPRTTQRLDGILVPRTDVATFVAADADSVAAYAPEAHVITLSHSGGTVAQLDSGSTRRGIVITALASQRYSERPRLAAGAALTPAELAGTRRVAMLSAGAADSLAPGRAAADLVGTTILLHGIPFTVRGVLARRTREGPEALVPWRAGGDVLANGNAARVPVLGLEAGSIDSVSLMIRHVQAWALARFGPAWAERIDVQANTARLEQWAQAILVFKLLMGAITGISLIVGGIGIMNVLLAAVAERTREIGIRKAVGARRRDVIMQFLSESLAITSVGGAVGMALGVAVAVTTAAVMRARTGAPVSAEFTLSTLLVAMGASVATGLTFGLYPALRAARLSPVDAMRHD